ncbi:MAG: hypothetical protein K6D92_01195 [Erysipelotrichaceae bacterium]|nr:hypothetical protein [Erysipelotrichaceae bacterium]
MRGEKAMIFLFRFFAVFGAFFMLIGMIAGFATDEILFLLPFVLTGLIFFLIGAIALRHMSNAKKERERLYAEGIAVTLPVLRTGIDSSLSVNGENPFQLVCEDRNPRDNTVKRYTSEKLWFDPFLLMAELGINELNVYIDRNDPDKYVVDVRKLIEEDKKRNR